MLSADRQTLTIFSPPGMSLEEREKESRAKPDSPPVALQLARAEADASLIDRALESYGRAERLGAALSPAKRRRLDETVRKEKHALLLETGRRAAAANASAGTRPWCARLRCRSRPACGSAPPKSR